MIVHVICFVVLLFANAYFSTIEAAYFAINRGKLNLMAESGNEKASVLLKHLDYIAKISAALRVSIVFSVLLTGLLIADFAKNNMQFVWVQVLHQPAAALEIAAQGRLVEIVFSLVLTCIISFFVCVLGEMVPKRIGIKFSETIAIKSIRASKVILFFTKPFSWLCRISANGIVSAMGIDPNTIDARITEEEIRMMIDAGGTNGSIDASEQEMIHNIFELDNTSVGDIATHRTDIVAIPLEATLEEIISVINEEKYSRIPVYDENIDNIVGIFHVKDMTKYFLNDTSGTSKTEFHISSILMKPYFVPFSKKTDELFKEMQQKKVHMAIVIDEYGGTAGLVTMEDVIEEIVGNIFDEYDMEEEEDIQYVNENTFLMSGTTDLSDVEDILNITFEHNEDYDTLGGYLIGQLGRIPDASELPSITINDILFQVEKMEEKRIDTIRVTLSPKKNLEQDQTKTN